MNDDTLREKLKAVANNRTHIVGGSPDGVVVEEKDIDQIIDEMLPVVRQYAKYYTEGIIGQDADLPMKQFEHAYHDGQVANALRRDMRTLNNKRGGKL